MWRIVAIALFLLCLSTPLSYAHSPSLAALLSYEPNGTLVVAMVDPLESPVPGATAAVTIQVPGQKPVQLSMAETEQGIYETSVAPVPADPFIVEFEAELWDEIFRTSIQLSPIERVSEQRLYLREFTKKEAGLWELLLFGVVTLGVMAVLVTALLWKPREAG